MKTVNDLYRAIEAIGSEVMEAEVGLWFATASDAVEWVATNASEEQLAEHGLQLMRGE